VGQSITGTIPVSIGGLSELTSLYDTILLLLLLLLPSSRQIQLDIAVSPFCCDMSPFSAVLLLLLFLFLLLLLLALLLFLLSCAQDFLSSFDSFRSP